MAILWQKQANGVSHEVRSAGNSVRLYTDGVFHSQYNPAHPVGGHFWDLLLLPAFFIKPDTISRVLVLGAGGGAVMQQLNHFLSADIIMGIDNNPNHLYAARHYFGIRQKPFRLYRADALAWVQTYRGESFDLVIDDLYGEQDGEPSRPIAHDYKWFRMLVSLLKPNGVLAMNFISAKGFRDSAWNTDPVTRKCFGSAFRLSMDNYENVVGVFCRQQTSLTDFKARLLNYPELDSRRKTTRLNFRLRTLADE